MMKNQIFASLAAATFAISAIKAADFSAAASATNQLGVELYQQLATGDENLCLSPYSIQSALAMTFAGADGVTRTEMMRVLRYPDDGIHSSFSALERSLDATAKNSATDVARSKKYGGPSEPIVFLVANRLFSQAAFTLHEPFCALVTKFYGAAFEPLDFRGNAEGARQHINKWVTDQTRDRIRDLIPTKGVDASARLILANAIYLKAPWASEFSDALTKPRPFHARGGSAVDVPTMHHHHQFGYARRGGFIAVALPYVGSELQFLILLPDQSSGLAALETKLTADTLAQCAALESRDIELDLPKFKFAPPTIPLSAQLRTLGLNTVFDQPPGSANFDRMAPRQSDNYLYVSEVFHKTFIAVDEKGTEAAAATAVAMLAGSAMIKRPEPVIVKVDRPFLYAIQHRPSGSCLFLGRVTDPR